MSKNKKRLIATFERLTLEKQLAVIAFMKQIKLFEEWALYFEGKAEKPPE